MKDLFVLTADADAKAVMSSVLSRHNALGIRPVSFEVDRHPMRDSGVVNSGPELLRMKKGFFNYVLLIWDYHGSGKKILPIDSMEEVQKRLDNISWKNASATSIIIPELEEWIWHNEASLCKRFKVNSSDLNLWIEEYAKRKKLTPTEVKQDFPKELFEFICLNRLGRTISPKDFEEIAKLASLKDWQRSHSFKAIIRVLRTWFPK